ncbi:ATP-binding protein [Streptomyces sp. YGL11-2]|uniref:ATP-binding protein n=1 Tax=Streptomyces sp. YGL11-2 TaxID=3414028 RepID=UPI003CEE8EBD
MSEELAEAPRPPADEAGGMVRASPSAERGRYERGALLLRTVYAATPAHVRAARNNVSRRLQQYGITARDFDARLLVSELVTNALRHSRSPSVIVTARSERRRLVIAVGDECPVPPLCRRPTAEDECGRGFVLLDLLADDWGVDITDQGTKIVWYCLDLTEPAHPLPGQEAAQ